MASAPDPLAARVVLADDHALFREALATALPAHGIHVIGHCGDGDGALALARRLRPDVLFLDYEMGGLDVTAVIEQARAAVPRMRIVVLSMHERPHLAIKMLEAGADGYALKSCGTDELVGAIRAVLSGEKYLAPPLVSPVIARMGARGSPPGALLAALSPREYQLLRHIAAGRGPTECAAVMGVSVSAAGGYRRRLLEKIGARTTADVVRFAIDNGLIG